MKRARMTAALLAIGIVSGCATVPGQDRLAERDPLEKFNRGVWGFNQGVDKIVLKPVTSVYRAIAPRPVRQGVSNAFANLTEPWSFINNLLQGKPKRAVTNLKRFVINSTIGVAGLIDQASKMGVQPANEDLGQTLAKWGVNGGPYLVLPLLGPSTLRDGVGSGAAAFADPVNVAINQADVNVWYKRGYRAGQIISARSDLTDSGADAFLNSSLDPYAAARSAYLQRRRVQILDQEDSLDAGPSDDVSAEPAAESVITPTGDASTSTPAPSGSLPPRAAALLGDDVAPAAPQPKPAPAGDLPESSAPMPGDDPAPAPPQ
jgi:phospholipid-binding lipoprotein MlaA